MKEFEDMTIFITGSTDGIGKLAAIKLSKMGAKVIIHGRNPQKLANVIDEIKKLSGNSNIDGYIADLSALSNVRKLASDFLSKYPTLDILINNAGIGLTGERLESQDGYELRFAVNYLAPFLLTHLLLPALKKVNYARIVNVSSIGQYNIDFNDVMIKKNYSATRAYRQSKLALVMFTISLSEKIKNFGITVNALHPGTYLDTKMVREAGINPFGKAETGADAEVYLATSPDLEGISGKFFDGIEEGRALEQAYNKEDRNNLWSLSKKLTEINEKE